MYRGTPLYRYTIHDIFINGHLVYFQFFYYYSASNILSISSGTHEHKFFQGIDPRMDLIATGCVYLQLYQIMPNCFSKWVLRFTSCQCVESSHYVTSLTCGIFRLYNFHQHDWCVVVFHCGFQIKKIILYITFIHIYEVHMECRDMHRMCNDQIGVLRVTVAWVFIISMLDASSVFPSV